MKRKEEEFNAEAEKRRRRGRREEAEEGGGEEGTMYRAPTGREERFGRGAGRGISRVWCVGIDGGGI